MTVAVLGVPVNMQPVFPALHNGGTTVNGVHAEASPFGLERGDKLY